MTEELLILYFEPADGDASDEVIDITDLVESLQYTTALDNQPGQLTLTVISDNFEYVLGARIEVHNGNSGIFAGYIFTVSISNDAAINITAFDQSRYLKNQDTFVLDEMTVDAVFEKMCSEWNLQVGTVDKSDHTCDAAIHEGRSIWDVISHYCEETFVATGKYYFIRDNFGKLELRDVETLHTDLLIDDLSVINNYNCEVSIDQNTYNRIKIGKENAEKTERVWVIVEDSTTQNQWGILQYHRKFNEAVPDGKLKGYAEKLLKSYNKYTQTLTLTCCGDFRIRAGNGIQIQLHNLKNTADYQNYIVQSCTHTVKNCQHHMQLDLAIDRV